MNNERTDIMANNIMIKLQLDKGWHDVLVDAVLLNSNHILDNTSSDAEAEKPLLRNGKVINAVEDRLKENGTVKVTAAELRSLFWILMENYYNMQTDLQNARDYIDICRKTLEIYGDALEEIIEEYGYDVEDE